MSQPGIYRSTLGPPLPCRRAALHRPLHNLMIEQLLFMQKVLKSVLGISNKKALPCYTLVPLWSWRVAADQSRPVFLCRICQVPPPPPPSRCSLWYHYKNLLFPPQASINVLLSTINCKSTEAESEAGSGKRKRREGGLLLRPIICICNDQ